jgi:hypothetical protein
MAASTRRRIALAITATVAVVASWIFMVAHARPRVASAGPTVLAALAIRGDAHGRPCNVVGRHAAQLEWYGGCVSAAAGAIEAGNLSLATPVYVVREHELGQPDVEALPGTHCPVRAPGGIVEVVRLQPLGTACAAPKP